MRNDKRDSNERAQDVWRARTSASASSPGLRLIREQMKRPRDLLRKLVLGDAIARRPRFGPRGPRSGA